MDTRYIQHGAPSPITGIRKIYHSYIKTRKRAALRNN